MWTSRTKSTIVANLIVWSAKIVAEKTYGILQNKCGTFPIAPRSGGSTQFLEYLEYFHLIPF